MHFQKIYKIAQNIIKELKQKINTDQWGRSKDKTGVIVLYLFKYIKSTVNNPHIMRAPIDFFFNYYY